MNGSSSMPVHPYSGEHQITATRIPRGGTRLPLRAWPGLLCIALASCGSDDDIIEVSCTLVGCAPVFELQASLELEVETLQDAQVSACRNGDCRAGPLVSYAASARQVSATLWPTADAGPSAGQIYVLASATDTPGQTRLDVEWLDWGSNEPLVAAPDAYDVTIEANGMSLYSAHKTVTEYQIRYPNGRSCGPACSSARFAD
jgi:hypothetical protein